MIFQFFNDFQNLEKFKILKNLKSLNFEKFKILKNSEIEDFEKLKIKDSEKFKISTF